MPNKHTARTPQNRVKTYTGTVHYTDPNGYPACGAAKRSRSYYQWSVATVTCRNCIARFGSDEPGHTDPVVAPYADEHAARRAAERADRQAQRARAAEWEIYRGTDGLSCSGSAWYHAGMPS